MQAAMSEAEQICEEPGAVETWLCAPPIDTLIAGLRDAYDEGVESLQFLHATLAWLHEKPPAWEGITRILSPDQPWTQAFCDVIIGDGHWPALDIVKAPYMYHTHRRSKHSLAQMQALGMNEETAAYKRWFKKLHESSDAKVRQLVETVEKEGLTSRKPMAHLLQHLHAKVVEHILTKACKESPTALGQFRVRDGGRTMLHYAAGVGDTPLAEVLIRSWPKRGRLKYISILDGDGYAAEDNARAAHFNDTADAIRSLGGGSAPRSRAPRDPVKLFKAAGGKKRQQR
jgi:hypothetical protein